MMSLFVHLNETWSSILPIFSGTPSTLVHGTTASSPSAILPSNLNCLNILDSMNRIYHFRSILSSSILPDIGLRVGMILLRICFCWERMSLSVVLLLIATLSQSIYFREGTHFVIAARVPSISLFMILRSSAYSGCDPARLTISS